MIWPTRCDSSSQETCFQGADYNRLMNIIFMPRKRHDIGKV